jgi:homoserine dehydrogenase
MLRRLVALRLPAIAAAPLCRPASTTTTMAATPPPPTTVVAVAVVGAGVVGRELLEQLAERRAHFLERLRLDLRVVAVANSRWAVLLDTDLAASRGGPSSLVGCGGDGEDAGWRAALARPRPADDGEGDGDGAAASADVPPGARLVTAAGALPGLGAHVARSALAAHPHPLPYCARVPVVVDATASDAVAARYSEWAGAGAHVVAANKRMGSGPLARLDALLERAASDPPPPPAAAAPAAAAPLLLPRVRRFMGEATVGAGLPVLSTLRALVETGDDVLSIEGVVSGTLSFIFSSFGAAEGGEEGGAAAPLRPFSAVVAEAREKGYTEPDPRDDLSGQDVARKTVILAREAGLRLELEDVRPPDDDDDDERGGGGATTGAPPPPPPPPLLLVPPALSQESGASVAQFMAGLPGALDARMAERAASAAARGRVLRYAARVDVAAGRASAGVGEYGRAHPFASLRGTENVVRFVTRRYPGGLVVRGPGAGAAVTAAGLLGDILALARGGGCVPN